MFHQLTSAQDLRTQIYTSVLQYYQHERIYYTDCWKKNKSPKGKVHNISHQVCDVLLFTYLPVEDEVDFKVFS